MIPHLGRALAAPSPCALHSLQSASTQFLLRRSLTLPVASVRASSSTSKKPASSSSRSTSPSKSSTSPSSRSASSYSQSTSPSNRSASSSSPSTSSTNSSTSSSNKSTPPPIRDYKPPIKSISRAKKPSDGPKPKPPAPMPYPPTDDPANPPTSTLPDHFVAPKRLPNQNMVMYLYRFGRAFVDFYWDGIKTVRSNFKKAQAVRERLRKEDRAASLAAALRTFNVSRVPLTRGEYHLMRRSRYDTRRAPFFCLVLLVMGQWSPLVLFTATKLVPVPCRFPSQMAEVEEKREAQRREARQFLVLKGMEAGVPVMRAPTREEAAEEMEWQKKKGRVVAGETEAKAKAAAGGEALASFEDFKAHRNEMDMMGKTMGTLGMDLDQVAENVRTRPNCKRLYLAYLADQFNVRAWPYPFVPALVWRRRLARYMGHLALDDALLHRDGGAQALRLEELRAACSQRGINTVNRSHDKLRQELESWLSQNRSLKWLEIFFKR